MANANAVTCLTSFLAIDPTAVKPDDWVDDASIPDPEDKKPDNWVDGPALIPDPEASKPDDWDGNKLLTIVICLIATRLEPQK